MKDLAGLLRSFRSAEVFSKEKPLHKIACLGTTLELLYRIKTKKKLEEASGAFREFIKPDSICFDVGAGYGRLTYTMAKLCPKGHVYSFEPEDYSYRVLSNLVKLAKLKNVTTVQKAVYDKETELELLVPLKTSNKFVPHLSYLATGDFKERTSHILEKTTTITIDDYCVKNNIPKVDFIKCDVEGAELFVLKGAINYLTRHRPVIFIEIIDTNLKHFNLNFNDMEKFFSELNYKSVIFKNGLLQENPIEKQHYDYFFIPSEMQFSFACNGKGGKK